MGVYVFTARPLLILIVNPDFVVLSAKWVDRVMEARTRELRWLRKNKWLQFVMSFYWDVLPLTVTIISFMAFVLIGKGELTVAIAFPALNAFEILTEALTIVRR